MLGVVTSGAMIDAANPTASAFDSALGEAGKIVFGLVIWARAITSVIGASYTSTSFLKVFGTWVARWERWVVVGFIAVSAVLFLLARRGAGQAAGLRRGVQRPDPPGRARAAAVGGRPPRDLLDGYVYPRWLLVVGVAAWVLTVYLGYESLTGLQDLFA